MMGLVKIPQRRVRADLGKLKKETECCVLGRARGGGNESFQG